MSKKKWLKKRISPEELNLLKNIKKNMRTYRILCNFTIQELSKKIERSPSYISQIESGDRAIDVITLFKIAKELNIQVSDLFCDGINAEGIERVLKTGSAEC